MSLNRTTSRHRTTSHRTTSRRTTSRRITPFSQTTGANCGYEPRISFSSSRGEVLARAHHRNGSLHRSAEKGFCCVSSRSCGYRIWSTPKANSHRMSLHTIETSLPVSTHHSHTSLQFWTRTVTKRLTTPVHMRYQTQVHCIKYSVHTKWSDELTVCTLTYIDNRDEWSGNHREMGLCRMKNIEVIVSGMEWWWGWMEVWKRWKMGCSAVSVMAQECRHDE